LLAVKGRVQRRDDEVTMHAQSVQVLNLQPRESSDYDGPLVLTVPEYFATAEVLTAFDQAIDRHPGQTEVRLRLIRDGVARVFSLPKTVEVSANLIGELKSILGRDCLSAPEVQSREAAAR